MFFSAITRLQCKVRELHISANGLSWWRPVYPLYRSFWAQIQYPWQNLMLHLHSCTDCQLPHTGTRKDLVAKCRFGQAVG
ncbi:hypothetical protein XENTR_v10018095 [Xenopus tropicalis]|nr:hypothetical protein XENTR_v10018095 [Xenopus tropicalis]